MQHCASHQIVHFIALHCECERICMQEGLVATPRLLPPQEMERPPSSHPPPSQTLSLHTRFIFFFQTKYQPTNIFTHQVAKLLTKVATCFLLVSRSVSGAVLFPLINSKCQAGEMLRRFNVAMKRPSEQCQLWWEESMAQALQQDTESKVMKCKVSSGLAES